MTPYALTVAVTTLVVAPVAYLLGRNMTRIMADVDRTGPPTTQRTCPPVDDYTRCKAMLEREGLA